MVTQRVQTPEQQKYLKSLLGYDFNIIYRPGKSNVVADALSRRDEETVETPPELNIVSFPMSSILNKIREAGDIDDEYRRLRASILTDDNHNPNFSIRKDLILYKDAIVVPNNPNIRKMVFSETHATPIGGHSGQKKTLSRLSRNFYWKDMGEEIKQWIRECVICQVVKPTNSKPAGLLQPMPTPSVVWEELTMDFITHLLLSSGKSAILVVVDRLSKASYFIAMTMPFTANSVAELFSKEII